MPSMASRGRGRRAVNEINMVPFIDVMLVLLIIFMVTAPMIAPSMIAVPTTGTGNNPPKNKIDVLIDKDEGLQIKADGNARTTSLREVASAVRTMQNGAAEGDTAVLISADRNVKFDVVVKVMDALKSAGVQRVGFAVQKTN